MLVSCKEKHCIVTARKRSLRRLCFHRCLSVHGGRGGSRSLSRGVSIPGGSVRETPWTETPQTDPRTETAPWTETPLRQRPPLQTLPPGQRPPSDRDPPDRDCPLDRDPRTETPPYGNGRAVRILLECILVN